MFLDSDNIQTGKKWREEIDTALSTSTLVVVFWCRHAKSSSEIRKEYRAAVNARKDIIRVLLDSTLPPRALAQYQWLDFRAFVEGKHDKNRTDSEESDSLNAIALPIVLLGAIAAWLTKTGWSPFSETTTIFVILGLLLAVSRGAVTHDGHRHRRADELADDEGRASRAAPRSAQVRKPRPHE